MILGGGGCSELRMCHCTPAWVKRVKKKKKRKKERKERKKERKREREKEKKKDRKRKLKIQLSNDSAISLLGS